MLFYLIRPSIFLTDLSLYSLRDLLWPFLAFFRPFKKFQKKLFFWCESTRNSILRIKTRATFLVKMNGLASRAIENQHILNINRPFKLNPNNQRLSGATVRASSYGSKGLGFDSRSHQKVFFRLNFFSK